MRVFNRKITGSGSCGDVETFLRAFTTPRADYTARYVWGVCISEDHPLVEVAGTDVRGHVIGGGRRLYYCNVGHNLMWIEPTFKDICRSAIE